MTGRERRLLRMLCMTAGSSDDDGGDKPFDELTWKQVVASIKTGKYKTFSVGSMKELDFGAEGIVRMQITGIDTDDLADGTGKASLSFIGKDLLKTNYRINPERTPEAAPFNEGTGAIGGWEKCELRMYLKETIKPMIPKAVRDAIKDVKKYSLISNASGTLVNNVVSSDDLWIPSRHEVFDGTSQYFESLGPRYSAVFSSNADREKIVSGEATPSQWWLRSARASASFGVVVPDGNYGNAISSAEHGIAIGFCL